MAEIVVHVHGKPLKLTRETIAKTWAAEAALCREIAAGALAGHFFCNDPSGYADGLEAQAKRYDAHEGRMSLSFIQRAVEIQTGECVPILADHRASPHSPLQDRDGEVNHGK